MKKFKFTMLNFFKKRMTADQVLELDNMIKNEVIKLILQNDLQLVSNSADTVKIKKALEIAYEAGKKAQVA